MGKIKSPVFMKIKSPVFIQLLWPDNELGGPINKVSINLGKI